MDNKVTLETILKAKDDMNKTAEQLADKAEKLPEDQKPIDETEASAYFINQAHNEFRRFRGSTF